MKLKQIAEYFKDQPDVCIEVWNKPYHWINENNYTNELWLVDMMDMVEELRRVNKFHNINAFTGYIKPLRHF